VSDRDGEVVELAPGRTVALRLHVSFLTSLFQRIGAQIREIRRGSSKGGAGDPILSRFAAVCPPIEILRWGEYAVRDAAEVQEVGTLIRRRAENWASNLTSAIEHAADRYKGDAWPGDKAALMETQRWLADKLRPIKDDIILGLRRGLELLPDDRPLDVVLVRNSSEIAGAHSHPVLIDTSRFSGASLIEVLFHEIGHEMLDRSVGLDRSGIAVLFRSLETAPQNSRVTVHDLLHVSLFANAGSLVREHFDRDHRPVLYERGRLGRMLQKMQVSAPESDVVALLNRHAAGEFGLDELARVFIDLSAKATPLTN